MNPYLLDLMEAEALAQLEVELYYDTAWDELSVIRRLEGEPALDVVPARAPKRGRGGLAERAARAALLVKVAHLPLRLCYTDGLAAYARLLAPVYEQVVEAGQTWRIERRNLNLRTHLKRLSRKTLCFSKSEHVHDNVIGMYIERYYYRHGRFSEADRANQRI